MDKVVCDMLIGFCSVPELKDGWATDYMAGDIVPHGIVLHVLCDPGYQLDRSKVIRCNDGKWRPTPKCIKG